MADEQNQQQPSDDPNVQTSVTPVSAAPPDQPPTQQPSQSRQQQKPGKNVHTMTTEGLVALKKGEFRKGQQFALKQLDNEARALGYKDFEDMKRQRNIQPSNQQQQPSNQQRREQPRHQHRQDDQRSAQRIAQLEEDKRKANRRAAQAEKREKEERRSRLALEAEHELKIMAIRAGVRDVDYAVSLLRRKTSAMSQDQLAAYDEEKFFADELRKSHPYLYGEEVKPAQTTPVQTSQEEQPPPPAPKEIEEQQQKSKVKDAKTMTRDEYQEHLRTLGLTDPSVVTSIPS